MGVSPQKLAKETLWAFLAKGSTFVLIYALDIFLARRLGVEKYGSWSLFFSWLTILMLVAHGGINASARKFIAQFNGAPELRSALAASLKLRVLVSAGCAVLLWLGHDALAQAIGRPDLASLFKHAAPLLFVLGLNEYLRAAFSGLHRIRYLFMLNWLDYGLRLVVSVVFLLYLSYLVVIVNAFFVAGTVAAIFGSGTLYFVFYRPLGPCDRDLTRDILAYSAPMFVIGVGFVVITELDLVMIGLLRSDYEVGVYAVAKRLVVKLPHISFAVAMGVMPVFAQMTTDNRAQLERLFGRLLRVNGVLFGAIAAGILACGWFLVPLIYGEAYRASILPLYLLIPYLVMFSFSIFISTFLDYRGLAMKRALNLAVTIALNVVLNLVLIPRYGGPGAAVATSVCCVPYLALNWIEVRKAFARPLDSH